MIAVAETQASQFRDAVPAGWNLPASLERRRRVKSPAACLLILPRSAFGLGTRVLCRDSTPLSAEARKVVKKELASLCKTVLFLPGPCLNAFRHAHASINSNTLRLYVL